MQRRDFIQKTALATSLSLIPNINFGSKPEDKKVRLGFIGVGLRGRNHLEMAMFRDDVEINALCDTDPNSIAESLKLIKAKGRKEPALYQKGEKDFENMVKRDDLDGIIISTPWEWHVLMSLA